MKLIFTVAILFLASVSGQYKACRTPNYFNRDFNGVCVPIRSCASLLEMLRPPISAQTSDFLRRSQCKVDTQPWVCCPNAQTATTQPPPKPKLLSAPNCGSISNNRIFGGKATKIDEFPWAVQLQYLKPQNRKGFHCGGSLINDRYVITAAHCIKKVPATWKLVSVRLGEWDTTTDPDCDDSNIGETVCNEAHVDVEVEEEIVHESYEPNSKNQHNDIALLRLKRKVQTTDFISPICLPHADDAKSETLAGHSLEVAGWGKTEIASSSEKKLKVSIKAWTNADCQRTYSASGIQIIDEQICAGGKKDSVFMDE